MLYYQADLKHAIEIEEQSSISYITSPADRASKRIIKAHISKFKETHECIIFSGEITEGPRESWFGEYMALYQLLRKLQSFSEIILEIYTDHQSLARLFPFITTCPDDHFSKISKLNGIPILSIRKLEQQRTHKTVIHHVKAHEGNFGNTIADYEAGKYMTDPENLPPSELFEVPLPTSYHVYKTLAIFNNALSQLPIRKTLKKISKTTYKWGAPYV